MAKNILIVLLLILVAACQPGIKRDMSPLNGAWKLDSALTVGPDGSIYPKSFQESFLLFSDGYYSMNWAGGDKPADFYKERFQPTDAEKLARYNSLLVNAGTYTLTDTTLSIHPVFALVPEFSNGFGKFTYALSGDTLQLDWKEIFSADDIQDPLTARGYHFKYWFVRINQPD